jgi:hypothetical protein
MCGKRNSTGKGMWDKGILDQVIPLPNIPLPSVWQDQQLSVDFHLQTSLPLLFLALSACEMDEPARDAASTRSLAGATTPVLSHRKRT